MATLSRCAFAALAAASLYGPAPVLAQQAKTPESELLSSDDLALRRKLQPLVRCLNEMGTAVPTLVDTYHRAYAVLNKNPKVDFPKMDYWFMQQYTG